MFDLFVAMFREEWRVHSVLFGSIGFALFPFLIAAMAFMGAFLVPIVNAALPAGDLATLVHALVLLLGVMVGGFGLVGNEVMERRFGQASFVAYAARTLPLSERRIFAAFVTKDTIYYLLLWILPIVAGVALASPFVGLSGSAVLRLALSLVIAFLTGLSALFLITTVYGRSKIVFAVLALVAIVGLGVYLLATGHLPPLYPVLLYRTFSWAALGTAVLAIGISLAVSLMLFRPGRGGGGRQVPDRFSGLYRQLSFLPQPALAAKDLLDLWRSGGGIGQILFSLLLPLGLCWFLLSLLDRVLPPHGVLLLFAVLTGVLASTVYTWLTAFDTFGAYTALPILAGTLIRSKLVTFSLLQTVPLAVVLGTAIASKGIGIAVPALAMTIGVAAWSVAVTVYLAGLSPNVLVYNPKVLASYLGAVGLPIIGLIALSFMHPWFGLSAALLLVPAVRIVRKAEVRWEAVDISLF
jgi:hypothetical protein